MSETATSLDRKTVHDYLLENPEFFNQHPDLLSELTLSHPSGKAVSLIEKQVSVLRERNTELRHRLNGLLESARENDRLYQCTKRLVLACLECDELGDLVDAIHYSFDKEFGVQFTQLVLIGEPKQLVNATFTSKDQLQYHLGEQLKTNRTVVGNVPKESKAFIFGHRADQVGSCAVSVLSFGHPLGVIAVGHEDPAYYHTHSGNLFINHIAEVVARLVHRLM